MPWSKTTAATSRSLLREVGGPNRARRINPRGLSMRFFLEALLDQGIADQFALILASVARVIRTSPSSAIPSAGFDAVVRFKKASR